MDEVEKLVNAGDTLQGLGKAREAMALYRQALQLEPGRVEARNNLGNAFLTLGQYDAAAGCYYAALEIHPNDARIHGGKEPLSSALPPADIVHAQPI